MKSECRGNNIFYKAKDDSIRMQIFLKTTLQISDLIKMISCNDLAEE